MKEKYGAGTRRRRIDFEMKKEERRKKAKSIYRSMADVKQTNRECWEIIREY